jgi:hypothetical protein
MTAACRKTDKGPAAYTLDSGASTIARTAGDTTERKSIANVGFSSPETALWDSVADVYLLSNINGKPENEDNNGFISRINPDGTVAALKWIQGGVNGVTLHGPKGMVIKADTLFAADVGGVRMFDRSTGRPLGTLRAETRGLNDLAIGDDGTIYATDLEPPSDPVAAPPPAAIYRMTRRGAEPVVKGNDLEKPDGLLADATGFLVAPFGASEVYHIDSAGTKSTIAALPGGQLDGLILLPSGGWAVTSWDTRSVYHIDSAGQVVPIVTGIESPAQLGFDRKRRLLLIPSFNGNSLELRALGSSY